MCGSQGKLYKTIIEDAQLNVCHECSKFGKVTGIVEQSESNTKNENSVNNLQKEILEIVVENYAEKIRKEREKLGLKQEEFAKKNE